MPERLWECHVNDGKMTLVEITGIETKWWLKLANLVPVLLKDWLERYQPLMSVIRMF